MGRYYTFYARAGAILIDTFLFMPLVVFFDYLFIKEFYIIILNFILWFYFIYFTGKYGQTIGKRIVGIKVLDINVNKTIGYRRAFYRYSLFIMTDIVSIIYAFYQNDSSLLPFNVFLTNYDQFDNYSVSILIIVEVATMLLNKRERALHDFFAHSVVVKFNESKEDLLRPILRFTYMEPSGRI